MAYSIIDQPIDYTSVGTPVIYTVHSDNFDESLFKYFIQIYESDTSEFIGEMKAVPQPNGGYGKFDISGIVQSLVDTTFNPSDNIISSPDSFNNVEIIFGEEYLDTNGNFQRQVEIIPPVNLTVMNSYPYWNEFLSLRDFNDRYFRSGVDNALPLTSRKNIQTVRGTKQWIYTLSDGWTNNGYLEVEDLVNEEVATIQLPTEFQTDGLGSSVGWRVDADYIEDNTLLTDLDRWRVRFLSNSMDARSQWIELQHLDCEKWDLYSLYYINRWGGIDSFSFNGETNMEVETTRSTYVNNTTPIGSTGYVDYSNTRHNTKDFSVKQEDVLTLNSGWISYSQQVAAVDLQTSQRVWLEDKDGVIIPVNINSDSIQIQQQNNRVLNVTVSIRYTQPTKRR